MTETISIRLQPEIKAKLDALAQRSKRTKSIIAAAAVAAYVESEEWQLTETEAGIGELVGDVEVVSHAKVSKWLNSWGTPAEVKPPR